MKKLGKILFWLFFLFLGVIIAIYILFIAGFMFIIPAMNDYKASQFEKQLTSIELPENTEFIDSGYFVGKLGNGNGIDYFIAMVIKSDQPKEKLKKYYKDYKIKEQTSDSVEEKLLDSYKMSFNELSQIDSFENYYIVYCYKRPEPDSLLYDFDLRGH